MGYEDLREKLIDITNEVHHYFKGPKGSVDDVLNRAGVHKEGLHYGVLRVFAVEYLDAYKKAHPCVDGSDCQRARSELELELHRLRQVAYASI